MFIDVLLGRLKYTHPHPHPSDGRKMSLFGEREPERTSPNKVSAVFSRGDMSESRPSRGENRTTKITNVYDSIVCALADQGDRVGIQKAQIEDYLVVKLGASQSTTLNRHLEIMTRLGYIKATKLGTAYGQTEYDLVGSKLIGRAHV